MEYKHRLLQKHDQAVFVQTLHKHIDVRCDILRDIYAVFDQVVQGYSLHICECCNVILLF